ncbi:MAG: DHH family phosphoesterase [Chloroflexaceae bacterium]
MASQLNTLLSTLHGFERLLILPHNNPDPDAIASAVALKELLEHTSNTACQIGYKGIIGRPENRALVRYLQRPMRRLTTGDRRQATAIAMVDTQPGTGNSALENGADVRIVIDHHPISDYDKTVTFADIRPQIGATATILTEYLQEAGIEPASTLATALFYGIKTDTLGLVRGATSADIAAYLYLQPLIDVNALIAIENAQVPPAYFRELNDTVQAARVYGDVVIAYIGSMEYPDLVGEMADLLLRLEGIQWSICMGIHNNQLIMSVRNRRRRGGAGQLARAVVGQDGTAGGHGMMAGGQVQLHDHDAAQMAHDLMRRILRYLDIPPETNGVPLLSHSPQKTHSMQVLP